MAKAMEKAMAGIDDFRKLPIKHVVGSQVSVEDLIRDYRWGFCNAESVYKWYVIHIKIPVYLKTYKFYTPTIKAEGSILLVECGGKPLFGKARFHGIPVK